jgi:hypothetical protein
MLLLAVDGEICVGVATEFKTVEGEVVLASNYLSTRPWRFKWSGGLLHAFLTSALD